MTRPPGPLDCDWYDPPARPGSAQAASPSREVAAASRRYEGTPEARRMRERMQALAAGAGR